MKRESENQQSPHGGGPKAGDAASTNRVAANSRARRVASLAAAIACLAFVASVALRGPSAGATPSTLTTGTAAAGVLAQGGQKFSHAVRQHAEVSCDSCHQREGNATQPRLPGHKACTNCHITEFTTPASPLCLGCHTNVESNNPPLKAFPGLRDFGMRFDHARHMTGGARPERGCADCHLPARRAVGYSIPAGFAGHENCYRCHTPGAQAGSSCQLCHALGSYSRPATNARAYGVGFNHSTHGARQGLSCEECHQVRAGASQTQQVASPQPTQHFGSGRAQNCMTCHNNKRAFGGDDFADCKRCHKGQTFRF